MLYVIFLYKCKQRAEDDLHVQHEIIGLSVIQLNLQEP